MGRSSSATAESFCAAFGLDGGPDAEIVAVSRGAMGQIWRLAAGGRRYAVKELFWEANEEAAWQEVAFAEHLCAAGIRLPASLPAPDGRLIARLPAELGGRWLRLYQWADGEHADPAAPGMAGRAGDLLGRLHAHALPRRGEAGAWYEKVPEPDAWEQIIGTACRQGAPWAAALAGRAGLLTELAALAGPQGDDQVTCHRDVHPENVLVSDGGELILVDWDDTGPASPDRELARLLADWYAYDGVPDRAAVRQVLAAYQAAGGPGTLRDERSFGMLIACRLNFLHAQAVVALDVDAARQHRDYAEAELADAIVHLPAPGMMTELISVAGAG